MTSFIVVIDDDPAFDSQVALVVALGHQLVAAGAGIESFSYDAGTELAAGVDLSDPWELLFGLFACQQLPRLYDDLEEGQALALGLINAAITGRLDEIHGTDPEGAEAVMGAAMRFRDELLAFGWCEPEGSAP